MLPASIPGVRAVGLCLDYFLRFAFGPIRPIRAVGVTALSPDDLRRLAIATTATALPYAIAAVLSFDGQARTVCHLDVIDVPLLAFSAEARTICHLDIF
jgi:hypothetical protein